MAGTGEFDRIVDALGSRYRRRLLAALTEHNPQPVERPLNADEKLESVGELVDEKTSDIAILHVHLPKLEDLEYIAWDRSAGAISKGAHFAEIEPTIRLLLSHDDELGVEWL